MKKARKLYESANGDRWYLIRDPSGLSVHPSRGRCRRPEGTWNMRTSPPS